jgi:hypothetical protein
VPLVENEYLIAKSVADQLAKLGYTVLGPAHTLAEASRLAAGAPIDAALLDWKLDGTKAGARGWYSHKAKNSVRVRRGLRPKLPMRGIQHPAFEQGVRDGRAGAAPWKRCRGNAKSILSKPHPRPSTEPLAT